MTRYALMLAMLVSVTSANTGTPENKDEAAPTEEVVAEEGEKTEAVDKATS